MIARRVALVACLLAPALEAQTDTTRRAAPAAATLPVGPATRRISTASAISSEQLGSITSVRQLPDGRVLLNDGQRRRLLLLDTTLTLVNVVLDSLSESENYYGSRPGGLLRYRNDTTLFVDAGSYAMVLIGPDGRAGRVRSVPRVQDASALTNTSNGVPAADANGRVVYRIGAEAAPPKVAPPRGTPWFPQEPDSAFIVGIDIDTRKLDTLGVIRIPKTENSIRITPTGGFNFTRVTNPMPSTDEWAVLPDGVIAFLRGRDYRVEYRNPDGTMTSSAKLPYDWQRLTDDDKQKLVDSVRSVQTRQALGGYFSSLIRWVNEYRNDYPKNLEVPAGYTVPQGLRRDWKLPPGVAFPAKYIYACAPSEEPTMLPDAGEAAAGAAATAAAATATAIVGPPGPPTGTPSCIPGPTSIRDNVSPPMPQLRTSGAMAPADLPDYRPPFNTNAVRADGDGNLWVRINTVRPLAGGQVYDVISRTGELSDRLQLPPGYSLVGFGAGRVVYLSMRDAAGIHLARVRLR